jgi:hypothetical protein
MSGIYEKLKIQLKMFGIERSINTVIFGMLGLRQKFLILNLLIQCSVKKEFIASLDKRMIALTVI